MEDAIKYICDQALGIGVQCRQPVFSLTVWHLIVIAVLAPVLGVLVHLFRRHRDISRKNWKHYQRMHSHNRGAVNYPGTLMLNAHSLRDILEVKGLTSATLKETASAINEKLNDKYFLVEFREAGKVLFRKDLKIRAGWKTMGPQVFRTDPETLQLLKAKSASDDDDDTEDNAGAIGEFDIFFRPVAHWDVRHWLNHPNREIRIGLWVAMFAAALEYGPSIAQFIRALFRPPSA